MTSSPRTPSSTTKCARPRRTATPPRSTSMWPWWAWTASTRARWRTRRTFSSRRPGKTTGWDYRRIWRQSTGCWKWIGWRICGGRIRSLRTRNRWRFRLWRFRIITCGCIRIRRFCIWWSKGGVGGRGGVWLVGFRLTLRLSCAMNFMIYPHDTQECKLQMESCKNYVYIFIYTLQPIWYIVSHTTDDMIFQWDPDVPLVVDENIELPQLALLHNHTADCTQVYSTGNFTCLEVVFELKRRLGYYLFHTYIPTCLIVIMSVSRTSFYKIVAIAFFF